MDAEAGKDREVTDDETLRALRGLRASRLKIVTWTASRAAQRRQRPGIAGLFQSRAAKNSGGKPVGKLKMLRWALSAYMLMRSMRRR